MNKAYKIFLCSLLISFLSSSFVFSESEPLDVQAESAILIDAETGQILYGKNEHEKMFPASTTKIMTLILALENSSLSDKVTVDDETPFEVLGSHIALEPGEKLTMEQLLDALALESANDAAIVIAKHISGSVDSFSELMNSKAKELGALHTNFVNPNGLPDESHVSTAYDLSLIAKHGMKNSAFRSFVSKDSDVISPTNKKDELRHLNNSNKLLKGSALISLDEKMVPVKYKGATGVKTGYTDVARHCLVASAKRGDTELISVVLKTEKPSLYSDTHKLLDYGFENFKEKKIASRGEALEEISWNGESISAVVSEDVYRKIPLSIEFDDIKKDVKLLESLKKPIEKGEVLGTVTYSHGGKVLAAQEILSNANLGSVNSLKDNFYSYLTIGVLLLVFLLVLRIVYVARKRKKKLKNKRRYKKKTSI